MNQSISITRRALSTLHSILSEPESDIIRDATIQRFEYCCDLSWKLLKGYLSYEGIICTSPKGCFRETLHIGLLSEEEVLTGLGMIDDRNMTTHVYREEVAREIYQKIPEYYNLMDTIVTKIVVRLENQ
ncbi:MAG TPA: HI0074 family nucleotidyltransferase substrate-binding subunit [Methanospirillum sp.]|nr:HI0074 family nucleotidyltransferase substrate-binding subunit [Methanospirillum sp.]